jgi:hypothetical protein
VNKKKHPEMILAKGFDGLKNQEGLFQCSFFKKCQLKPSWFDRHLETV